MRPEISWFGVMAYGLTALLYGAAATGLFTARGRSGRAFFTLAFVLTLSSLWAGCIAAWLLLGEPPARGSSMLDAVHLLAWTAYMSLSLSPASARRWLVRPSVMGAAVVMLAGAPFGTFSPTLTYSVLLIMALIGLLAVEQVMRNAREERRRALSPLCLAVGTIFVTDVFLYSQTMLLEQYVPLFWVTRAIANAAALPLLVIAMKRQPEWDSELFLSRQVVFYTASLVAVGSYLLVLGLVAYVIRASGAVWNLYVELAFLLAGFGLLGVVLFSERIRARARVFLLKHFYRSKYDYREQWLRLTQSLGRTEDVQLLAANALNALARIIGSQQAALWLSREPNNYECVASIDNERVRQSYDAGHPMVAFLVSHGWVIDSEEYQHSPDRYGNSFGSPGESLLPANSVIVPLDRQGYLQGFVALRRPVELRSLNFEDHDILKTAGRQVAVVLAQALAQEKLAETRQFEATTKFATFLMHDLKNVVAQQELVVANAQRFRHRPEFIDDAMITIRAGVERMKKVLEQLSSARRMQSNHCRVDVSKALMEVRSHCSDRMPVPEICVDSPSAWVGIDRDKLTNALIHLVRNAQDATPPDGRIVIEMESAGSNLFLTVSDTGQGMDRAFVRNRLFRPFDSTKGERGMGVGAYQVRETVRACGGDVSVESQPGVGTKFQLRLPLIVPMNSAAS